MTEIDFSGVLSQQKLQDLVSEIDPKQVLDEDVEEVYICSCNGLKNKCLSKNVGPEYRCECG